MVRYGLVTERLVCGDSRVERCILPLRSLRDATVILHAIEAGKLKTRPGVHAWITDWPGRGAQHAAGMRFKDRRVPGRSIQLTWREAWGWRCLLFTTLNRPMPWSVTDASLRDNYEAFGPHARRVSLT